MKNLSLTNLGSGCRLWTWPALYHPTIARINISSSSPRNCNPMYIFDMISQHGIFVNGIVLETFTSSHREWVVDHWFRVVEVASDMVRVRDTHSTMMLFRVLALPRDNFGFQLLQYAFIRFFIPLVWNYALLLDNISTE